MLLITAGCASLGEGYTAHYGLTNPESPPGSRDLTDEAYGSGIVGDQYIEEYEEKYRQKNVLKVIEPEGSEGEERQP
jgi:hypothetical protein